MAEPRYATPIKPSGLTSHGGGWALACDLSEITLRDVYTALGSPEPFAMGNRTEAPGCLVEQAVNAALDEAFDEAEALLLARMGAVTLAAIAEDFHRRLAACGGMNKETRHAV